MIDIEKVRRETPHCTEGIFLNSAGASLPPTIVTDTIIDYLKEEARVGGYKVGLSEMTQSRIHQLHVEVAKMINCRAANIAFVSNATDGFAQALSSIPWQSGDIIITTDDDYISNHAQFWRLTAIHNIEVVRIKNDANGALDLDDLQKIIKNKRPKLISVTHIPTNTGKIQDVYRVGKICHEHDILYIVDACQSAGQMPLDVMRMHCDFLTASGRKFLRGPRGTGFLYVSDKVLHRGYAPLRIDSRGAVWSTEKDFTLRDSALRYELWEQSYATYLGLVAAVRYANDIGLEAIASYNAALIRRLRASLSQIPEVVLLDHGSQLGSICTFIIAGRSVDRIKEVLDRHLVYYSIATSESALIDFHKKGHKWAVRLSPHYFNTVEEIDRIAEIIATI